MRDPGLHPPPSCAQLSSCRSTVYPACQPAVAYTRAAADNVKAMLQATPKQIASFMRAPAHRVSIPQPQNDFPLSFSRIHISRDFDVELLGPCW
jgi:hypothetical protein